MRIHDGAYTIGRILDRCRVDPQNSPLGNRRVVDGVDLDALSRILSQMPVKSVQARRERLNTFYEEVLVSADAQRGISFHSCLMILAHHNVINDSKSLRLEEFLRRRARLQRVEEAVQRNTVVGFFDTLYWSREFRRKVDSKKSARMSGVPQFTVPEIFVDGEYHDGNPDQPDLSRDVSDNVSSDSNNEGRTDGDEDTQPMLSPTLPRGDTIPTTGTGRHNLPRIDTGLAGRMSASNSPATEWSSISPSLVTGRGRAHTTSSYDPAPDPSTEDTGLDTETGGVEHSRQHSAMSVNEVMQSLGNSAWGESIRRSFTQRRSGDRDS